MRIAILAAALALGASIARAQLPSTPDPTVDRPLVLGALEQRRELLLARRRHWQVPLVVSALGAVSLIAGGIVFYRAWNPSCDIEGDDCNYSTRGDRAGLVMMPLGAAHVIVGTPLFAVRLSRTRRLARVERALARLRSAPLVVPAPSGAALTWSTRF